MIEVIVCPPLSCYVILFGNQTLPLVILTAIGDRRRGREENTEYFVLLFLKQVKKINNYVYLFYYYVFFFGETDYLFFRYAFHIIAVYLYPYWKLSHIYIKKKTYF